MEADMDEVWPGLYVGSVTAANDTDMLQQTGITHVLTVGSEPLTSQGDGIVYKYVQKHDMPDVDLLSHFGECFDFIDDAVRGSNGKILIHCLVGSSRSATVAIAYMMYKDRLTLDEALCLAKQHRPRIRPNEGFMEQLAVFDKMGAVIDPDNVLHRKYRLGILAQRVQSGCTDEVKITDFGSTKIDKTQGYYRCKKCRQSLFKHSSLLTHDLGEGEAAFDWRSKAPGAPRPAGGALHNQSAGGESTCCDQSLFIEPVQWMADIIHQLEGKLLCPKCQQKIGSFVWYGEKCPCGTSVAPAFHIQTTKIDHMRPANKIHIFRYLTREKCPCGTWVAPAFHIQTTKVDHMKPAPVGAGGARSAPGDVAATQKGLGLMTTPGPTVASEGLLT